MRQKRGSFLAALFLCIPLTLQAGSIDLQWDGPTTNSNGSALTDLASYRVYWRTSAGSYSITNSQLFAGATATGGGTVIKTVTNAGLVAGSSYLFTVRALDVSGNESVASSPELTATIPAAANTLPTITDVTDKTVAEDGVTAALTFTIADAETPVANLTLSGTSSNTGVVADSGITFGGSGANRTVTVRPLANQSGAATITLTVTDANGGKKSDAFVLTVTAVNDAPTISDVSNQSVNEDTVMPAVTFIVGDVETAAGSLSVSGTSSNQTIVPNANIAIGGTGANRTVSVTPASNQNGSATITLTVSDGSLTGTDTFVLTVNTVNDSPTISSIANQTINEDVATGALTFTVGDVETAAGSLTVTRTSGNQTLIPLANVVLGGSGANRTVTVTPGLNQVGSTSINLTVSDGLNSTNTSFTVTVNAVNDAPTISDVTNQSVSEDGILSNVAFIINDIDTAVGSLTMSGSSSNTSLIPNGNIVFGGSGANRTVTITPAANQNGSATITLTVSDGNLSGTDTFVLTVGGTNDAPTLSAISDRTITEDGNTSAISFTVGDLETAAGSLTISANSGDPTIVPVSNIVFGGSGANRTVTVTPAADQFGGPVLITLNVSDGLATTSRSFNLTITAVNDTPTIDDISAQSTVSGVAKNVPFTVHDKETAPGSLAVSATSSDQASVPDGNFTFSGSGANRTVTITPLSGLTSQRAVTITVRVSDANTTSTKAFTLTINPANNNPPLVTLTAPTGTLQFTSPANIVFGADASDTDGTVSDVSFMTSDNQIRCSDVSSPYTCTWANVPAGVYTVSARARDNGGALTNSPSIQITVTGQNQIPVVDVLNDELTITMPTNQVSLDATVQDDGPLTIVWTKVSGPGSVSFGNTSAVDTTATFSQAGVYVLRLRATDSANVTTSDEITVTVNSAVNPGGGAVSNAEVTDIDFMPFKNSFNPSREPLVIRYSIKDNASVQSSVVRGVGGGAATLVVYDRKGQVVKSLEGSGGQAEWDGRNNENAVVASGTYLAVLKSGNKIVKRKVVVFK